MLNKNIIKQINSALLNFFSKELVAVVLYGSYAENRETTFSDIDILIILDREILTWRESRQIGVGLRKETSSIGPISPKVISQKELSSAIENFNPLILNILLSGNVLYDTGKYTMMKEQFEEIVRNKISRNSDGYWEVAI